MQIITSLEELRQKAVGYRAVPVAGELFSDVRTPIEVLRILKNVSSHCFLFESVENQSLKSPCVCVCKRSPFSV